MKIRLKPLSEQVMVITGASSGIGLTTARLAAKRGAKLIVAARSEDALKKLAGEITAAGGQAFHVAADVSKEDDVRRIAAEAASRFGSFDTWVNDAGVSVYGRADEVNPDDARRLFETNFWGVVNGSRVAIEQLRRTGGALINLGSIVSDRAIPLQSYYSASKHAVKGFTDALRMELEEQAAPVSVTLIKPAAIDTPFTQHAKNYMEAEPDFPPPVYAPDVVAEAILHCAETPERDVTVGGGGRMITAMGNAAPRLTDKYMERTMFRQQKKDRPNRGRERNALYSASNDLSQRGDYEGHVMETSFYTKAALHPLATTAALIGVGLAAAAAVVSAGVGRAREPGWKEWAHHPGRTIRRRTKAWW